MPEHGRSDPPFWINDKDERGQPLDAEVLGAAERIWARVVVLTRSRIARRQSFGRDSGGDGCSRFTRFTPPVRRAGGARY